MTASTTHILTLCNSVKKKDHKTHGRQTATVLGLRANHTPCTKNVLRHSRWPWHVTWSWEHVTLTLAARTRKLVRQFAFFSVRKPAAAPPSPYNLPVSRAGWAHPHVAAGVQEPLSAKPRMATGRWIVHAPCAAFRFRFRPVGLGACAVVARCRVLENAGNGGPVSAWRSAVIAEKLCGRPTFYPLCGMQCAPPKMVHVDKDVHAKIPLNYKRPPWLKNDPAF